MVKLYSRYIPQFLISFKTTRSKISQIGWNIISFIYPNVCLGCHNVITEASSVCHNCFVELKYKVPSENSCRLCSKVKPEDSTICFNCHKYEPNFFEAKTCFIYEELIKKLILGLKYNNKMRSIDFLGRQLALKFMENNNASFLDDWKNLDLIIVPVPLHKKRLVKRGFNQSAMLAKSLYKKLKRQDVNVSINFRALTRCKFDAPQKNLSVKDRRKNLEDAFLVKYIDDIKNRNILLVDDVLVSGATANSCSKELLEKGARSVRIISVAHTDKSF
ncbi:MAG: ComF family protein [Alphaproteobacteria bacterium]|nr:ComF family protein [Alphaproteobacteria bacterium]MBL0717881.1 ComF family protein [Alphaproteobacteria bacterium]